MICVVSFEFHAGTKYARAIATSNKVRGENLLFVFIGQISFCEDFTDVEKLPGSSSLIHSASPEAMHTETSRAAKGAHHEMATWREEKMPRDEVCMTKRRNIRE